MRTSPVWHPFTQHGLREPIPLVERASGAILYTRDGRRIIDGALSDSFLRGFNGARPIPKLMRAGLSSSAPLLICDPGTGRGADH